MRLFICLIFVAVMAHAMSRDVYTGKVLMDHHGDIEVADFVINLQDNNIQLTGADEVKNCPIVNTVVEENKIRIEYECISCSGKKKEMLLKGKLSTENGRITGKILQKKCGDHTSTDFSDKCDCEDMKFFGFTIVDK